MHKKILVTLLVLIITTGAVWYFNFQTFYKPDLKTLWLGDAEINVELAQSQGERAQGLGGRKSLPQDQGMFFIFEKPDNHPFWMRDMNFPLDIIWLDENYRVTYIEKNVNPSTYPKSFGPDAPTKYVLETNTGWAESNDIRPGNKTVLVWEYLDNIQKKANLIKVSRPQPLEVLPKTGALLEGQARGYWFFEASFPARISDQNGNIVSAFKVETANEWTTDQFVSFDKDLVLDQEPNTKHGFLVLEKDNPSGLPEKNDKLEIPIKFR